MTARPAKLSPADVRALTTGRRSSARKDVPAIVLRFRSALRRVRKRPQEEEERNRKALAVGDWAASSTVDGTTYIGQGATPARALEDLFVLVLRDTGDEDGRRTTERTRLVEELGRGIRIPRGKARR